MSNIRNVRDNTIRNRIKNIINIDMFIIKESLKCFFIRRRIRGRRSRIKRSS